MKYRTSSNKKITRNRILVCTLLFSAFSWVYLSVFQGDMILQLIGNHFPFQVWLTGSLLTLLLIGLSFLVRRLTGPEYMYLPAFLALGVFTFRPEGWNASFFFIVVLLSSILFVALGKKKTLNACLLRMIACSLLTVSIGNTDEKLHYEWKMKTALQQEEYSKVLQIGQKSLSVSRKMTEMRLMAMVHTGQLGDLLFLYPQLFGSHVLPTDSLPAGKSRFDYSLAACLLDKNLSEFRNEIPKSNKYYASSLPRYYQEALLLCNKLDSEHPLPVDSSEELVLRFEEFWALRKQLQSEKDAMVENNLLRRQFGDTYWYYYFYSPVK